MSSMKDKSADKKLMMNNLHNELDVAVFEEEMDVEKVKEILGKMERIDPDADKIKKEFNKDLMWQKIQKQYNEEMAEESAVDCDEFKTNDNAEGQGKDTGRKGKVAKKNSGKVRRILLTAATIVVAVFVGANIGTYATEKKNVIEYMQDLKNGTSFWVTGDATSMEFEEKTEVFYSWNDVPNEYKEYLVIPQGLPEDMGLYDIEIKSNDVYREAKIRYINGDAKKDFSILVMAYKDGDFSFANLVNEEGYKQIKQKEIEGNSLSFYFHNDYELVAFFVYKEHIYIFNGTLEQDMMQRIVEKTIEFNF